MQKYHDLLKHILENGVEQTNRTGINTISTFGYQARFNLQEGFPIVTTKKTNWNAIVWELAWFLRGETNIKWLQERGIKIWNEWADENGELGPGIYGKMWRDFGGVDQISQVIEQIKTNPTSRRLIVTAWNPPLIPETKLPPCHLLFQFSVTEGKLSCLIFQRSVDSFLGLPFNFASYALLTHVIAKETGLGVGELIHVSGDLHIYTSHLNQVKLLLSREPYPLPKLELTCDIDNLTPEGAKLINYQHHPFIKAEVAV